MNRRCEFIAAKKSHHATIEARRVVGVSKSSWYRWEAGAAARAHKQESNGGLARRIRQVWLESGKAYGVPRITAQLRDEGWVVNHKRVRRLTRQLGIVSCMPYRPPRTTQRGSGPIAEDLLARVFQTEQPNRAWVTDITFIRTREGWLYLAAYIDLFSRRVVGYSLSSSCDTQLVLDALRRGLRERRPGEGLIAHSDQGCQYTSRDYLRELRRFGIRPSMGRVGTCFDNAVAESFWASLKKERLSRWHWDTRAEATREVHRYIRWYNSKRLHSTLGNVAPTRFEAQAAA